MKIKRIAIIFTILALAALACNLGSRGSATPDAPGDSAGAEEPAGPVDAGEPGDTGSAGEPGSSSGGSGEGSVMEPPNPLDLDDPSLYAQPDSLSSYRTTMDYVFEAPGPVTGTVLMDGATQVEPFETTLEIYMYGLALDGSESVYTFTQILETQYIVVPGFGCTSGLPGLQGNPFDIVLDTGGTLTGMADYIGEETVNGVPTYVYNLTMDNIDPFDPAGKDFESLEDGKLYIAQDTLTVVRGVLDGTGVSEVLSQDPNLVGDIYYEINFFDFDAPVDVVVPAGCADGAESEESVFPMTEDASEITQFADEILTYITALSVSDAADFYEDQMPALGCGEATTQSQGEDSITMLFPDCETGDVTVLIFSEGEGRTLVSLFAEGGQ